MTKYDFKGEFEFEADDAESAQEEFLSGILSVLPDGAKGQVNREHIVVDVPDLTEEYVNYWIAVTRIGGQNIHGVIDAVFDGSTEYRKVVVIKGAAHELYPYELAVLTPPVSVGIKEPDEVEETEVAVEEARPTEEQLVSRFIDLVNQSNSDVLFVGTLLTRTNIVQLLGEIVTEEEFRIIGPVISGAISESIRPTLLSLIKDTLSNTRAVLGNG